MIMERYECTCGKKRKNKQQEMLSLYERLLVVKSIESYYGKS
jgi:hypothetical protein